MPSSKDLAQRPRRSWEPFVRQRQCQLRVTLLPQCPRNQMCSRSQRIIDNTPYGMQQELLRSVRAHDIHAYRSGQHATRM